MTKQKTRRDQIIQNIIACGQSLIDNAEKIAGDYKFLRSIDIFCCITDISEEVPTISVTHNFLPEIIIEQVKDNG